MSDEQRFLTLGNGKQISIDKLFGKLEKKDIASNNKLLKIFDFFDKDGNGVIENSNSQGANEIISLWDTIKSSATKNGNSILEENEANELLENIVDKDGKTLKDNGIFAKDLFGFLKFIVGKEQEAINTNLENITPVEYTAEEIKEITINDMDNDIQKARELFEAQKNNQGDVSNFVNDTKENFDTKLASSRVERYIKNEEFTNYLIKKSNSEEGLSEKEYLELKVNHLINLISSLKEYSLFTEINANAINFTFITGKKTNREQEILDNELELSKIKEILERLTPEEINTLTSQVLQLEDSPEQDSRYNIEFGGKNNTPKADVSELNNDSNRIYFKNQGFELEASKGSIKSLSETNTAYRKMSFEETFKKERGVEYSKEKIEEYLKKEAEIQFLLGIHNRNEQIKNLLKDSTSLVKGNNSFGADSKTLSQGLERLETDLNLAFRQLYGEDIAKTQEVIDEILGKNSGVEVVINENYITELKFPEGGLKDFAMVKLSEGLQNKLDKNFQTALQGKSLEEHSKDLQVLYKEAYGDKNSEEMAKAFIESQQEGVQNTKAVVQGAGMVAMVGAQLIPVGGQLATSLVAGSGTLIATFGSTAVSAAENYSKAGGPTEEDKQAMLEELKTSLALVGSGIGIGKASSGLFRALVAKNCPKFLAWASEVGADTAASLLADYAITGQIDISGEGIAQIQNILVGLLHAKGNLKGYINTHAGDLTNKTASDVADVGKLTGKKNNNVDISELPKGSLENDNMTLTRAKSENPAERVSTAIIKDAIENGDFDDSGMRLWTPESLDAELKDWELYPNRSVNNLETLSLIINGKLSETLKFQYEKLGQVFKDIVTKNQTKIRDLENKYANDKTGFAQEFIKILAKEFSIDGIEPKIEFVKLEASDGAYDWKTGTLYLNDKLTNSSDIQTMIAHEFVHFLQFKDIVTLKGKDGVKEIYLSNNCKNFLENKTREELNSRGIDYDSLSQDEQVYCKDLIADCLAEQNLTEYNVGLAKFAQEHPFEEGSLNQYLARIYKSENKDMAQFDTSDYYNQVIEREAYFLGNGKLGDNTKINKELLSNKIALDAVDQSVTPAGLLNHSYRQRIQLVHFSKNGGLDSREVLLFENFKRAMNKVLVATDGKGELPEDVIFKEMPQRPGGVACKDGDAKSISVNRCFLDHIDTSIQGIVQQLKDVGMLKLDINGKFHVPEFLKNDITRKLENLLNTYNDKMKLSDKFELYDCYIGYLVDLQSQIRRHPFITIEKIMKIGSNQIALKKQGLFKTRQEVNTMSKEEQFKYLKGIAAITGIPKNAVLIRDIDHTYIHELGHLNHMLSKVDEAVLRSKKVIEEHQNNIEIQNTCSKVTRYAQSSPMEFVAEVFSGLVAGQKFDDDVMALYLKYKGPQIFNMN